MRLRNTRTGAALALAVATAAVMTTAAPAADPVTPCAGFVKEDPAGDNTTYLLGNDTGFPSEANGDLLGLFVNRTSATTTLYLKVAEVNKTIPPGSNALAYRVFYTQSGQSMYLEAGIDAGGTEPYFEYGTFETTFEKIADVKGTWADGPNGVIGWEIPPDGGGKASVKFTDMYGWPGYLRGGIYTPTDYIPDGGESSARITYNGASCPESGTTTPPATGGGGGTTTPPPGQSTNPNPGKPAAAKGPLVVTVSPKSFKAKKVKKAKKLALKLETKEQLTSVVVTLKKGKKALGSGKLAKLTNISKLNLKLKKKGLKKGSYSLVITAKRADGTTGTVTLKLKVA